MLVHSYGYPIACASCDASLLISVPSSAALANGSKQSLEACRCHGQEHVIGRVLSALPTFSTFGTLIEMLGAVLESSVHKTLLALGALEIPLRAIWKLSAHPSLLALGTVVEILGAVVKLNAHQALHAALTLEELLTTVRHRARGGSGGVVLGGFCGDITLGGSGGFALGGRWAALEAACSMAPRASCQRFLGSDIV